ncbi:MAG: molecular chaperone [Burkholderiales bacterium]
MSDARPLHFVPTAPTLPPEEEARANLYALLARLFYLPPDRGLLQALAAADELPSEDGGALAQAWSELAAAAGAADEDAVREEYENRFIGTGKADVTLYTGAYTVKTAVDNPLVDIRAFMIERGLARREDVHEPEDHIAGLCEIMRHLVAEQRAPVHEQRAFFKTFIAPAANPLCDAIEAHPEVRFYKPVARVARAFLDLEHATLDME